MRQSKLIPHLLSKIHKRPITRFAPSPTGYLHLGHVASAIFVWGIGRALGAEIILRIEDHDRSRCSKEFERAILDDLKWLGFVADRGVTDAAAPSEFRQSDHPSRYAEALVKLASVTPVYACECSRRDIAGESPALSGGEFRYPGRCRAKGLPFAGNGARALLPDRTFCFEDAWMGPQEQNPSLQCGDVLVRERRGHWTYQFCVAVDDLVEGVDLIIRGEDLLSSSGRQIALAEFLGRGVPSFFLHHPLLTDGSGKKLGKRFLSEGVIRRRLAGEDPRNILGEAACLAGLTATQRKLSADDLQKLFGA